MPKVAFAAIVFFAATAAFAQDADTGSAAKTMGQLVSEGYEIKAAAPNGSRYVIFMQNDQSAYACEFVNTAETQCRPIN